MESKKTVVRLTSPSSMNFTNAVPLIAIVSRRSTGHVLEEIQVNGMSGMV